MAYKYWLSLVKSFVKPYQERLKRSAALAITDKLPVNDIAKQLTNANIPAANAHVAIASNPVNNPQRGAFASPKTEEAKGASGRLSESQSSKAAQYKSQIVQQQMMMLKEQQLQRKKEKRQVSLMRDQLMTPAQQGLGSGARVQRDSKAQTTNALVPKQNQASFKRCYYVPVMNPLPDLKDKQLTVLDTHLYGLRDIDFLKPSAQNRLPQSVIDTAKMRNMEVYKMYDMLGLFLKDAESHMEAQSKENRDLEELNFERRFNEH